MKTKLIYVVLLISLFSIQAISQIKVSGKVTSAEDGSAFAGINILLKGTSTGTVSDVNGDYSIEVPNSKSVLVFSFIGLVTEEIKVGSKTIINVQMSPDTQQLSEVVVSGKGRTSKKEHKAATMDYAEEISMSGAAYRHHQPVQVYQETNTEEYAEISENGFKNPFQDPISTFSIDVDAASYSNVRRFLNLGQMPPKDAVRIEEMINYFDYDYEQPKNSDPFAINTEVAPSPWNKDHKLVHIGLQGKDISMDNLPPSNLVFLLDVSGSMSAQNKLPLLKSAFKMLIDKLRPEDKVAIVVYAGAAGEVLPSTSASEKDKILDALDQLNAGGSTAGGAGIELAYKIAQKNFIKDGNNRIILATDGDFNVGASSDKAMEELIEEKRDAGVFLTVLGFGMGNYKDSKMEILADKGNGNYAYIDNILEAKKVLVNEFGGTLFTIAKDVKIQVEFNPAKVQAYRLVGYENRLLAPEDFNNDKKDAGELGAGHTVTALYEIIPVGVKSQFVVDDLKYQKTQITEGAKNSSELMTVKLRYKKPDGDTSKLIVKTINDDKKSMDDTSDNFRWSAAVAAFGMQLRDSDFKGDLNYLDIMNLAKSARGKDEEGYRAEFIRMVESCKLLARN
ncbi:vWA domain-containing protein [Fulvivirga lutea]|uniref:von Willebrand factor type A domain-containing protein n=1 Tax=Fulvivirga lutea TaxID=2810512 RepID=A0A975A116_9BACT|nr:VWA domain-containing protein [Fulvivirga lutea]QSE97821.1 von Willebrand factor type A domain-containing protein [Fulvivirga lutea]